LLSGGQCGAEVHAGSFLRERRIVLDRALLRFPSERNRILAHEIFHFVWWKLNPRLRFAYEGLLHNEIRMRAKGEMGWSSEWRKQRLLPDDWRRRTRRLKDYLSESFCDTAAAVLLGLADHEEITLPARVRRSREVWMKENIFQGRLSI
jgi:hypothetical protein